MKQRRDGRNAMRPLALLLFGPHCDGMNIERVQETNPKSHITWFRCQDCGRMFPRMKRESNAKHWRTDSNERSSLEESI